MKCPRCGALIDTVLPTVRFCPACGNSTSVSHSAQIDFNGPPFKARAKLGSPGAWIAFVVLIGGICAWAKSAGHLREVLVVLLAFVVGNLAFLFGSALFGFWRRVAIEEVALGGGPALLTTRVRGCSYAVRLLPISTYVKCRSSDGANLAMAVRPYVDGRGFDELRGWERTLFALSGPFAMLAMAFLSLGPQRAWSSSLHAIPQWITGTLSRESGVGIIRHLPHYLQAVSVFTGVMVITTKLAVLQLTPMPIFNGGAAVCFAIEWATGRRVSIKVQKIVQVIGLAFLLVFLGLWLRAFIAGIART